MGLIRDSETAWGLETADLNTFDVDALRAIILQQEASCSRAIMSLSIWKGKRVV